MSRILVLAKMGSSLQKLYHSTLSACKKLLQFLTHKPDYRQAAYEERLYRYQLMCWQDRLAEKKNRKRCGNG